MKINAMQKCTMVFALCVTVIMLLFPPWTFVIGRSGRDQQDHFGFILSPEPDIPDNIRRIDKVQLGNQLISVIFIATILLGASGWRHRESVGVTPKAPIKASLGTDNQSKNQKGNK
jgi:hypothetical protein